MTRHPPWTGQEGRVPPLPTPAIWKDTVNPDHIDATIITAPLREARAGLMRQRDDAAARARSITDAAREAANQLICQGVDEAAPHHAQVVKLEQQITRIDLVVAREEAEALAAKDAATGRLATPPSSYSTSDPNTRPATSTAMDMMGPAQ